MNKLKYIINILIVFVLLASIAVNRDARVVGKDINELFQVEQEQGEPIEYINSEGERVINSLTLAKDAVGFGGYTPVNMYVKDNKIVKVEYGENSETPSYFNRLVQRGFAEQWQGMTLQEAVDAKVDVVSGATFTSHAVAVNVSRAASYALDVKPNSGGSIAWDLKNILGLLVILLGVIFTLIKLKNKVLEAVQMALNVVVLGFMCGSFLSMAQFVSWASNGLNLSVSVLSVALLLVVIIMPLLNRKGSYCHIHCPMGSAQTLVSMLPVKKIKINTRVARVLNNLRYYILICMLFVMWLGVGFEIMDYEVFSAFMLSSASLVVMLMAIVFLLLSLIITRPYCRFVCPTGALITMTQKTK